MLQDYYLDLWLRKQVWKNLWRVPKWYDFEDLLQDGYMCYQRMLVRYEGQLDPTDKRGVTALFKKIFSNHIHTLNYRKDLNVKEDKDVELDSIEVASPEPFEQIVAEAPDHIRKALRAILANPSILTAPRTRTNGKTDDANTRLRRLLGYREEGDTIDLLARIRQYLEVGQ